MRFTASFLIVLAACGGVPNPPVDLGNPGDHHDSTDLPATVQGATSPPTVVERVLKDETSWVAIELNSQTVFCTAVGYSSAMLKVSIPDLDWIAHFDHR